MITRAQGSIRGAFIHAATGRVSCSPGASMVPVWGSIHGARIMQPWRVYGARVENTHGARIMQPWRVYGATCGDLSMGRVSCSPGASMVPVWGSIHGAPGSMQLWLVYGARVGDYPRDVRDPCSHGARIMQPWRVYGARVGIYPRGAYHAALARLWCPCGEYPRGAYHAALARLWCHVWGSIHGVPGSMQLWLVYGARVGYYPRDVRDPCSHGALGSIGPAP